MAGKPNKALVVGVGAERGLGAALSHRFAREGRHVLLAGRTAARIEAVATEIRAAGGGAEAVATDATDEAAVMALFDRAFAEDHESSPADLIVFNAGNNQRNPLRELPAAEFEAVWRAACFGGFLVGREAARRLAPFGRGSVIFTGATASLRGRAGFAAFAAAKAGLRAVAQSFAREFGPQGIHVAHVVIDGGIDGEKLLSRWPDRRVQSGPDGLLSIEAIAETYWQIHQQHRSAWSHEVDLRPWSEAF